MAAGGPTDQGCARGVFDPLQVFATGAHPAGAGPTGLQDVLLTPAELLRTTADTISPACGASSSDAACLVTSLSAGGIDAAQRIELEPQPGAPYPTFSFRCVWTEG